MGNNLFSVMWNAIKARFTRIVTKIRMFTRKDYLKTRVTEKVRQFFQRLFDVKPRDKEERKEEHRKKGHSGSRYQSVNNENSATIEFRIFKGTLIANTYRAAVEFCLRLVDYIITHEEGTETLYDFLHYKPLPESMSKYMAQRHINF